MPFNWTSEDTMSPPRHLAGSVQARTTRADQAGDRSGDGLTLRLPPSFQAYRGNARGREPQRSSSSRTPCERCSNASRRWSPEGSMIDLQELKDVLPVDEQDQEQDEDHAADGHEIQERLGEGPAPDLLGGEEG